MQIPLSGHIKEAEQFQYPQQDTERAILLVNTDEIVTYCSPIISHYSCFNMQEVIGKRVSDIFPELLIKQYLKEAGSECHAFRFFSKIKLALLEIILIPFKLGSGDYFLIDMHVARDSNENINKFKEVLEFSNEAITITDINGMIEYVNPVFEEITGYSKEQVVGHTHSILKSDAHEAEFFREMWTTLLAGKSFRGQFVNRRQDGTLYYEDKIIRPFYNEQGVMSHFISSGRDVSDRVQIMHRLEHLANHDCLTGLPNRSLFLDRLHQAEARGSRNHDGFAVVILDLDGFKAINDSFGHAVGDVVLQTTAYRIRQCLREEDTVARLGGDEFSLILTGIVQREEVTKVLEKIGTLLNEPLFVDNENISIRASMGVAIYPDHGANGHMLLKHADSAMYQIKIKGGNNFRIFEMKEDEYTVHSLHKYT
ncbi:MAG: diguanylate cyclase domain-containing protein [Sulfuriferula sp.]